MRRLLAGARSAVGAICLARQFCRSRLSKFSRGDPMSYVYCAIDPLDFSSSSPGRRVSRSGVRICRWVDIGIRDPPQLSSGWGAQLIFDASRFRGLPRLLIVFPLVEIRRVYRQISPFGRQNNLSFTPISRRNRAPVYRSFCINSCKHQLSITHNHCFTFQSAQITFHKSYLR